MIRLFQGIDIVSCDRIEAVCRRHEAFLAEAYSASERDYCLAQADPYVHLAGRFAAKEAVLKALGLGLAGPGASLAAVEVVRRPSGQPALAFTGWVARLARRRRVRQSTVSISHSAGVAVASVILVAAAPGEA